MHLRRGHIPGYEIARRTGLSPASVSRILRRAQLSRWRDLHPAAARACATNIPAPGDLLHLDIKGMTRFSGGHAARRRPTARQEETSWFSGPACGRRRSLAHGLHPDAARSEGRNHHRLPRTRLWSSSPPTASACAHCLPTTAAVTAHSSSATPASRWISNTAALDLTRHRTNGKAERFIQTALREWAYAKHWTRLRAKRRSTLQPWIDYYNRERPHGSLNYKPPISRSDPEQPLDHLQAPRHSGNLVSA